MKIKKINIDIGDLVLIKLNYNKGEHIIKKARYHVGFVTVMRDNKSISIKKKKLINSNFEKYNSWKDLFNVFKNTGIANFGFWSQEDFWEGDIIKIEVLKKC